MGDFIWEYIIMAEGEFYLMRSKKAMINIVSLLAYEIVAIVCGFVLPYFILSAYGSSYNGITSSIIQFLGYAALMKAGIGGVTQAALYKPLADNNAKDISAIINATDVFFRKVAVFFSVSLILFASIYPMFVQDVFDWFFTFTLVVILGINTFAQYFFGLTYQFLLTADQRQCVISFVQIGTTLLNTTIAVLLIRFGAGIHVVKFVSALVFSLNPIIINLYARKKYNINKEIPANNTAIKNRWDCLGLEVANFVNTNTDMFILTILTNVYEVSVYTIYFMITNGIRKFINAFFNGIRPVFGHMFARREIEAIYCYLRLYEQITFCLTNFFYSVVGVMLLPFVQVYTKGIADVEYIRPAFAYVLVIATMINSYRIPYQSIVTVVGHFKQTRNGAFFEAGMNIVISITLVWRFGLIGVAAGTLCAAIFRTIQYATYMSKNIIKRSLWLPTKRLLFSIIDFVVILFISKLLSLNQPDGYMEWALQSVLVCFVAGIVILGTEIIFYSKDLQLTFETITRAIGNKKNYKHEHNNEGEM